MASLSTIPAFLSPLHRRPQVGHGASRRLPANPKRLFPLPHRAARPSRSFQTSAMAVATETVGDLQIPSICWMSVACIFSIGERLLHPLGGKGISKTLQLRNSTCLRAQFAMNSWSAIYRSGFRCQNCNKSFSSKDVYLDLTVTSGTREYTESKPARTELFRSPLVSFLYERGWRQNFSRSGFPGLDEEFKMAQDYFKPVASGLLLDVSCGSGLFSRKFASSGTFSGVIALDFSENMLRQCYEFIAKDTILNTNLALVRADVSRLPFQSGSVDAVHAGAALHCWPSPSNAVAEISRVLRSGGVFVATTFLASAINSPFSFGALRPLRQVFGQITNSYNYFTEEEIEDLCKSCGLTNYSSKVDRAFIMFSAQKP